MSKLPLILAICVCSSFATALGEPVTAKQKLNVLFIISDDLTATAFSGYGNRVCKTPNIDRFAA